METIYDRNKISIYGRQYEIKGDATREEIALYASYIDKKIEKILNGRGKSLSIDIAILIALNIVEDLFKIKEERDEALRIIQEKDTKIEKCNELIKSIDNKPATIVIDYKDVKEEINGLEKECEKVRKEALNLKTENNNLQKEVKALNKEISSLKNKNIQMQIFIPEK